MLDILLARPHDLDRTVDMLRDLDGASDTIDLEPAAEIAADQMIVRDNLVQGQTADFAAAACACARAWVLDSDFATVIADVDSTVHRLHGCVR